MVYKHYNLSFRGAQFAMALHHVEGTDGKRGGENVTHKIWNASNVFGGIAFMALMLVPGAWEGAIESGGPYIVPIALTAAIPIFTYLSMREDGKRR